MNGIRITRKNETLFVPLPKTAQRKIEGGCRCPHCTAHPEQAPMWDTLALSTDSDFTWTVHYPELQSST